MNAKDKTEEVLKSLHILFSKAEPIENSKRKVIIDKDRMMQLLKELNDCMYAMMDEYEITERSKEKAKRALEKESDEKILESRKKAEDIYAASIMFTDHALNEIQTLIDNSKIEINKSHEILNEKIEKSKQILKDNQIDLRSKLSGLIDTQKYLMLIENENNRLRREAEKLADNPNWQEPVKDKIVPEIRINEEYFRAAGLLTGEEVTSDDSKETDEDILMLDNEYFAWKEENEGGKE